MAPGAGANVYPAASVYPTDQAGPLPDKSQMNFDEAPPAYFPPDMSSSTPAAAQPPPPVPTPRNNLDRSDSIEDNTKKPAPSASVGSAGGFNVPELPEIPNDIPAAQDDDDDEGGAGGGDEEIDLDDLTKRFEALKKRK